MPRFVPTDVDLGLVRTHDGSAVDSRSLDYRICDHPDVAEHIPEARKDAVILLRAEPTLAAAADSGRAPSAKAVGEAVHDAARGAAKKAELGYKRHHLAPWEGDQGNTPRCTVFAGLKALLAGPRTQPHLLKWLTDHTPAEVDALMWALYDRVQAVDVREGRVFGRDGGATSLALAKGFRELGLITGYAWGFTVEEYLAAIRVKPVLHGTWWRDQMDDPAPGLGVVRYSGRYRGGHEYCSHAADYAPAYPKYAQTWGYGWGVNGVFSMPLRDGARALADDGELLTFDEVEGIGGDVFDRLLAGG